MSKHKNRGHMRPGADDAIMASVGALVAEAGYDMLVSMEPIISATNPDPFLAEDMTFRTTHDLNVVTLLNSYLNDFRKAHPSAALLQMIPTGPASFTFVWEL